MENAMCSMYLALMSLYNQNYTTVLHDCRSRFPLAGSEMLNLVRTFRTVAPPGPSTRSLFIILNTFHSMLQV